MGVTNKDSEYTMYMHPDIASRFRREPIWAFFIRIYHNYNHDGFFIDKWCIEIPFGSIALMIGWLQWWRKTPPILFMNVKDDEEEV